MTVDRVTEIVELPIDRVHRDPRNPQERTDAELDALCETIREHGMLEPIQVVPDGDDWLLVGGEGRHEAMELLGEDTIPAFVLDRDKWDEDQRGAALVRLNVLRGKLNPEKFTELYNEMAQRWDGEVLQALMGFTERDAFESVYQTVKAGLPPDLARKLDDVRDEIRTIDDLSMVLNRLFTEFGETLPSNMMVFGFGGKQVLWIRCHSSLWKLVSGLAKNVADDGDDVAAAFEIVLSAGIDAQKGDPAR